MIMKYKITNKRRFKMSEPYIDIWTGLKFIPSINGRLCHGNGRSFYADGTPIEI